jgi:hypothetical protein
MTADELTKLGYAVPRLLPTGEWAGLQQMFYTVGLFVGLDETGYRTRFCYEDAGQAFIALMTWDGQGDPCGPWIKNKGTPGGDRHNPRMFYGIPVVMQPMERGNAET